MISQGLCFYRFLGHIHNIKFTQKHLPFSQISSRHCFMKNILLWVHPGNEICCIRRQIISHLLGNPFQSTICSLQQSVTRLVWSKLLAYVIDNSFLLSCLIVLTKYASECIIWDGQIQQQWTPFSRRNQYRWIGQIVLDSIKRSLTLFSLLCRGVFH